MNFLHRYLFLPTNRGAQLPQFLFVLLTLAAGCKQTASLRTDPAEPALSTFALAPGFQIELVAKEPLVADPVAMEIDEYGRLYVVEMHGYPLDKSGTGKVKLLTDTNGDGQMDQSSVFAEGLMLPTGIMRWKKGVLVTDPPHVLYLEDSDGDGKADVREVMLTGFAVSNPQHNVNNPVLGLDNWIYLGHEEAVTAQVYKEEFGDRGGDIHYPARPAGPRLPDNASGRSVRFRPDQFALETTSAKTQFGHTFDTWGRHLLVSNANHIYHEVLAAPYLQRAPDLLVSNASQSISDHGTAAEVFPITTNPEHQLLTDVGVFTSASGITFYGGGLFPQTFDSVTFVAEPVSNLVHADWIREKGATFAASRVYPEKEFLASTDAWFRPVNMYVGPDGALYVVDYYRQIIEHPEWMAEEVVKSGALYNGTDKGRIYRITPTGTKPATWPNSLRLGDATNEQLVEKLADPNSWWRRNAQRLLLDRQPKDISAALERMAANSGSPEGRLHALWTLEGLNQLRPELIRQALQDPVPEIRENAVKLAEGRLASSPALAEALVGLQDDPNAKVRFQLLSTLGFVNTPEAARARENILFRDVEDPWVQIAALSAVDVRQSGLLESVLQRFRPEVQAYSLLVERLSAMAGASDPPSRLQPLIRKAVQPGQDGQAGWQAPLLNGLAEGLKNKKASPGAWQAEQKLLLHTAFQHSASPVRQASLNLLKVIGLPASKETNAALARAAAVAADRGSSPEKRTEAIAFLALSDPAPHADLLKKVLAAAEPLPVQLAALRTLSALPDQTVSRFVVERWPALTPELRDAALNTFLVSEDRVRLLLDALEEGKIDPASIGWRRSVRLMNYANEALRNRSRELLAQKEEERQEVVKQYHPALSLAGEIENGKLVYQKNCAVCHQMGGAGGVAFGPDLGTIRNRRPESIMADILAPNLSIADGHDLWLVELKSGESLQGIIATETPTALTLRNYAGQESTIARQDIESLKALGMSAMPTGLEKGISQQDMADLLAFLKKGKI